MSNELNKAIEMVNNTRYKSKQNAGHYESYFLRANHPNRPYAFWIRYTIFSPHSKPDNAIGELWATFFNDETNDHVSVKEEISISHCIFDSNGFDIKIGDSFLEAGKLKGQAALNNNIIKWDLSYSGESSPLFLLPLNFYNRKLPKAKSIVSLPMSIFKGKLVVNGKQIAIKNWVGSQNHNWGLKHTDHYAWGQVAGFDNYPDSFIEVGTARLKIGPLWTPFMTVLVLRHNGKEYSLNSLRQILKAKGKFNYFNWQFSSETSNIKIDGMISAQRENFAGLTYYNPPGGIKYCLNSKIASCKITLTIKEEDMPNKKIILNTENRAAFEILTDDQNHNVRMYV